LGIWRTVLYIFVHTYIPDWLISAKSVSCTVQLHMYEGTLHPIKLGSMIHLIDHAIPSLRQSTACRLGLRSGSASASMPVWACGHRLKPWGLGWSGLKPNTNT